MLITNKFRRSKGDETIRTCLLDRDDLVDLYTSYVNRVVRPAVNEVQAALNGKDIVTIGQAVRRANRTLLHPSNPFVGLSHDAIQSLIPSSKSLSLGFAWHATPSPR